jgi:hypothetical protein
MVVSPEMTRLSDMVVYSLMTQLLRQLYHALCLALLLCK